MKTISFKITAKCTICGAVITTNEGVNWDGCSCLNAVIIRPARSIYSAAIICRLPSRVQTDHPELLPQADESFDFVDDLWFHRVAPLGVQGREWMILHQHGIAPHLLGVLIGEIQLVKHDAIAASAVLSSDMNALGSVLHHHPIIREHLVDDLMFAASTCTNPETTLRLLAYASELPTAGEPRTEDLIVDLWEDDERHVKMVIPCRAETLAKIHFTPMNSLQ